MGNPPSAEPARAASSSASSAPPSPSGWLDDAASCIGPTDAKHFAVYLHGVDSETPSQQEQQNRAVLERVARAISIRFALPRASRPCPTQQGSLCWGWKFDDAELQRASRSISGAAARCFADREYGLVGFSNGGYLLNKLVRRCELKALLPQSRWLLSVGSARLEGPLESEPRSLTGCGRLVLLSGNEDTYNFDPKHHLFRALEAKGANVEHLEFDGGHSLEETGLRRALERSIAPHPQPR